MKSERLSEPSAEETFWHWFSHNTDRIADNPEDADLVNEIDQRVEETWPELTWEVGPDPTGGWYFALSPNLNRELVAHANEAIALAPSIKGWKFYATRQRKVWNGVFELESNDEIIQIDSARWRYVLLRHPNGDHEIVLFGADAESLDEDERWQAAAIVLEGLLGEQCLMEKVSDFALEAAPEPRFIGKEKPVQMLPQAFGMQQP